MALLQAPSDPSPDTRSYLPHLQEIWLRAQDKPPLLQAWDRDRCHRERGKFHPPTLERDGLQNREGRALQGFENW